MRLPRIIQAELDRAPGRWRIAQGKKHKLILIDERLISILPQCGGVEADQRGFLNIRAQIRRHLKKFQHAAGGRRRSGTAAT